MSHHDEHIEHLKKINEMINSIEFAMLTTVDEDGTLRSRPMATQRADFDGELWFFTAADAPKVDEVEREHQVNVSFTNPDDQQYVSMSGTAHLVRDRQKIEELWNPVLRTWFPDGLDDPKLALLHVKVSKAEYWDSSSSVVVHAFGLAKALVTGQPPKPGENEKVDFDRTR